MLGWIRIAITVGALLTIVSETGAAEFGNPGSGNAPYLWSGSKEQPANNRVTPSFNPTQQKTSNLGSPSQQTRRVSDPSVARAADALAAAATPGDTAYKIGPLDVPDISEFQPLSLENRRCRQQWHVDSLFSAKPLRPGNRRTSCNENWNSRFGTNTSNTPVTVTVKQFNSSRVTVSGAVKALEFSVQGRDPLQFVTMVGGLVPEAN
jgi:protein involved in polysaccharide export with SLBB domain